MELNGFRETEVEAIAVRLRFCGKLAELSGGERPSRKLWKFILNAMLSIQQLWSFNHHDCDRVLLRNHIDIPNINLSKGPADVSIWGGSIFLILWEVGVLVFAFRAYRRIGDPRLHKYWPLLGAFSLCGIFLFGVQFHAIAEYAETCSRILSVRP
jgi:hypothetical protein